MECHTRIVNAIIEKRPDIVLHVGDVVSGGSNYKDWGSDLFEPVRKLLKNTPVYIVTGGGGAILESLKEKRSFFTAESAVIYHYCLVKIVKNYFQMMVYDIEGKLLDFLIINK